MDNVTPFLRIGVFEGDEMSTNETYEMLCEVTASRIYESSSVCYRSIWDKEENDQFLSEIGAESPELKLMIETEIAWFLISALCRDLTQFAIQYGRNIRIRDAVQDAITLGVSKEIASHLLSSSMDLTAEYNRLISQYN